MFQTASPSGARVRTLKPKKAWRRRTDGISVWRRRDGGFAGRVVFPDGTEIKRRVREARTEREARLTLRAYRERCLAEGVAPDRVSTPEPTSLVVLRDLKDDFLDYQKGRLERGLIAPQTFRGYETSLPSVLALLG